MSRSVGTWLPRRVLALDFEGHGHKQKSGKTEFISRALVSAKVLALGVPSAPQISVICPSFNPGRFLGPAIESIRAQTETNWELIVVDDGSTDGTRDELAAWERGDPRISVHYNDRNRGAGWSLNRAAEKARGTWLARMDADDFSLPSRLVEQRRAAESQANVSAVTCYIDWLDENGHQTPGARGVGWDMDLLPWFSLFYNRIAGGGQLFCSLETFRATGGFGEGPGYGEDRELWFMLLDRGPVALVRKPLYQWRSSAGSFTNRLKRSFRYSDRSLQAGMQWIAKRCGCDLSLQEAILLRDFWVRYDDGTQNWDTAQRRLLELARQYRGMSHESVNLGRIRKSIAAVWLGHALRAVGRRDTRAARAHLHRSRQAVEQGWPSVVTTWALRLAQVRGRADRLL